MPDDTQNQNPMPAQTPAATPGTVPPAPVTVPEPVAEVPAPEMPKVEEQPATIDGGATGTGDAGGTQTPPVGTQVPPTV